MPVKKLIPFILLLVSTLQVSAQKNGFIAISGGPSNPMGKYADNTLDVSKFFNLLNADLFTNFNPTGSGGTLPANSEYNFFGNNGFAKTGYQFGADAGYYFFKNLGLAGSFYYGRNNFDDKPLNSFLSAFSTLTDTSLDAKFSAGNYQYFTGMIGPTFGFKHERLSLDLRVLAGIAFTSYPQKDITIKIPDGNNPGQGFPQTAILSFSAKEGEAFVFSIGSTARYNLSDKFAVFIKPEILHWRQTYKESLTGSIFIFSQRLSAPTNNTIPVTVFNTSFGLAYQYKLDK